MPEQPKDRGRLEESDRQKIAGFVAGFADRCRDISEVEANAWLRYGFAVLTFVEHDSEGYGKQRWLVAEQS
jgi:hypothetical protein